MRTLITITLLAVVALAIYGSQDPYGADKLLDAIGAAAKSMIRVG